MIRPRNALKTPILKFLTNSPESTGREISNATGEEIHNIHNALLRLFINRLVTREKGKTKKSGWRSYFIYSITQKGKDRLDYYGTLKD
jgi:transcription initiation factor IIE alpha subunit